jgi:hypothetical protein
MGWVSFFIRVTLKLAGAMVKCDARQKAAAPNSLECRESQLAITDDNISRNGKWPENSSLHTVINHAISCTLKGTQD